jgi:hypothetical protein
VLLADTRCRIEQIPARGRRRRFAGAREFFEETPDGTLCTLGVVAVKTDPVRVA